MSSGVTVLPAESSATQGEVDPFVYNYSLHQPALQVIKMVLVGLILFPIRVVVLLLSFFFFWLTACIGSLCMPDVRAVQYPQHKPITRFFLHVFARLILWSVGFWWISIDGECDPRAKVIVANHCSVFDPFFFTYHVLPMAVAKAELFGVPMLRSIAKVVQAIPVSRATAESRHDVSHEIKRRTRWGMPKDPNDAPAAHPEQAEDECGVWPPLLIFPEATCTNTKSIIQFKFGAFAPRVPVQPVALDFRQSYLDVSWPGDAPVGLTLLRMMCQVYNKLHVTYLPVAEPLSAAETVPAFAARVQHSIADVLKIPVTHHTFTPPVRVSRRPGSADARPAAAGQQEGGSGGEVHPLETNFSSPDGSEGAVAVSPNANSTGTGAAASPRAEPVEENHDLERQETIPDIIRSCSLVP